MRVWEYQGQTGRDKRAKGCLIVVLLLLFLLAVSNIMQGKAESKKTQSVKRAEDRESAGYQYLTKEVYRAAVPIYAFADEKRLADSFQQLFFQCVVEEIPLLNDINGYAAAGNVESRSTYEELIALEIEKERTMLAETVKEEEAPIEIAGEWGDGRIVDEMVLTENQSYARDMAQGDVAEVMSGSVALRTVPSFTYDWSQYQELEDLVKGFYIVDPTTTATADKLNIAYLAGADMTMQGDNSHPQILIYHTHSQEGFADSVPGDVSTGVVGAGEYLAELLREQYGFSVIHHTGQYDVESRDNAYSYAEPAIRRILDENPSIEVVIDLHRDEVKEGVHLVTDIDGRPTAKFMFFNGLSYSNKQGNIGYLYNPYIKDNLAFSFQAQALANEYYPGLTRGIYLRALRYNMHFRPKNMLIELGAQNNTREEIWNAVPIIAQILGMELNGER